MPHVNLEERRKWSRANYLKHREERLAYAKAYRASHKAEINEYRKTSPKWKESHKKATKRHYEKYRDTEIEKSRKWRTLNPEKVKAYEDLHREKRLAQKRDWSQKNSEYVRFLQAQYQEKENKKMAESAAYYAEIRARNRIKYAKMRLGRGGRYTPNVAAQIPDWACKGEKLIRELPIIRTKRESYAFLGTAITGNSARVTTGRRRT